MPLKQPPIQDNALTQLNRFSQTWIAWFRDLYKFLSEQRMGWAYYQDGTYTTGSPRSITSGRTQLTIDGVGVVTNTKYLPSGVTSWFYSNKFTPDSENDAYVLRIDFSAVAGSNADKFNLELQVGVGDVIYGQTLEMNKGMGVRHSFSVVIPVWVGSAFLTNGGTFYINTTNSFTLDTIGIYINKTYKA